MTSLAQGESKSNSSSNFLFMENYQILQKSPEIGTNLSHNYHTLDLVTSQNDNIVEEFILGISLDISGSMSVTSTSYKSILDYCIHTVINIIKYLERVYIDNEHISITLIINAFDDKIEKLGMLKIGQDSSNMIKKLKTLYPRGGTDISNAFNEMSTNSIYKECDNTKKAHILFTDGIPNKGSISAEGILKFNPGGDQIFIGYGTGHDAKLLQEMAKLSNGSYHFVDTIENAGMVYGEIIHSLLYKTVEDVKVYVEGVEVYDFNENCWTNKLNFTSFASEHVQTLVMRSPWNSVELPKCNIIYTESKNKILHSKTDSYNLYNCTNGEAKECDRNISVEKQIFRQRTMELLNEAMVINGFQEPYKTPSDEYYDFKNKLDAFYGELKKFMETKKLNDDAFMIKLLGDIYTASNSISPAFIGSRLTSQGLQRAYQVNYTPDMFDFEDHMFRSASVNNTHDGMMRSSTLPIPRRLNFDTDDNDRALTPPPTMARETSCYTTPSQINVMRCVSGQ